MNVGGGSRIRTGDIRLAKATLYQLSYTPENSSPHYAAMPTPEDILRGWLAIRRRFTDVKRGGWWA